MQLSLVTLFITAFIMGFSGAMMPGPLLTVNINESYRRGISAGPLLIMGHGFLELLLVIGLTLGLGAVLVLPLVKGVIALVGGLVLLWMGWDMVKEAWQGAVSLELAAGGEVKGMQPVLAGAVVSLSNPYWVLWWATIGVTYVTLALQKGILGLAVFLTGHVLSDFVWYTAVSLAVVSGRKLLSDKVYRGILITCGLFLLYLAIYFIWSGKNFLLGT